MVDYWRQGSVAVIAVNNPPVNALSYNVRVGLYNNLDKAANDRDVLAVVICGKGRTFPVGADIHEFGQIPKEPWITDVGRKIESLGKPVIAAIHGTGLGGGLEIALFCHYRIALPNARVGLPEVLIGLLPAGGGAQLLPRLAGIQVAMEMITTGRQLPASEAAKYNIIDKVVSGDIVKEGIEFALRVQNKPFQDKILRYRSPHGKDSLQPITEAVLRKIKMRSRGFYAPVWCVRSIANSVKLPFEEGLAQNRIMFQQMQLSGQAKALQYAFFAERSISKWKLPCGGNFATAVPRKIKTISVIGAGTMGTGITVALLSAGFPVLLVEQNKRFLMKGVQTVQSLLEGGVKRRKFTAEQAKMASSSLTTTVDLQALNSVDLVIEAVFETLSLKEDIFSKLDKICKPEAILCSNTSYLNIDKIAASTRRPDKVVGTHFFSPAHIMRLMENIYGCKTSPETVATVMDLGKRIGKVPVLVGTCPGFCANRMNRPQSEEALFLVEEGAQPEQIDQVLEDFGMPMGPFKVRDLAGGDIGWRSRKDAALHLGLTLSYDLQFFNGERYCSLADKLCELGRFGQKTGSGWYSYDKPGSKQLSIDEDVTKLIQNHRDSLGIKPRKITTQEIQERFLFSGINEGFKILEEGIAARPEDIDIIWLYGFGFPRHYGGPMFYASQIGLKRVYDRICHYHELFPYSSHWMPSKLLQKLSIQEVPIGQWAELHSKL
ncbi:hypothetical protein ScPMuIL_016175 [Solemya velum]